MKQPRNTNGLTWPFSTVISGLVASGAIIGTLFSVATWDSACTAPEVAGPTIATTLSSEISFVAALAASAGSDLLSASTRVIFYH